MTFPLSRRTIAGALAAAPFLLPALAEAQAPPPGSPNDPRPKSYPLIGQPAAPFSFPKLGGGTAQLSDYAGKTLILYWWGLWCPDCVLDGPNVAKLAAKVAREKKLAFLAIHTRNRFGKWGTVERYFEESGYSYPIAFYEGRDFPKEAYAIAWYPSFLVIDPKGVIRAWRTDLGAKGGDQLLKAAKRIA